MGLSIGIDVGGTKIAGGVVDDSGRIISRVRRPSPADDAEAIVQEVIAIARELADSYDAQSIGIGAAGFVSKDRRTILFAPNIAWRDEPLADRVEEALNLPVVVENDANAAAWGEFTYGVGANANSIVFITLGTGVGGGIIIDGQLLRGSNGFAGEIGHLNLIMDGIKCGCGSRGCWEQYSSGTALVRMAREAATADPERARTLLDLAGGNPAKITGRAVTQAARMGCRVSRKAFDQVGRYIGFALADLVSILDPDMFVLAGGLSEAGSLIRNPAEESFMDQQVGRDYRPTIPIVTAKLGNDAGMIGAADLARRAFATTR
ncbi:ROK family glucokinase [Flaviflexus huanghaiensis]|uniref:ROK family glucokinase n=1 Tax=Flaviflexus huanghaiensis TaxID=1111473 RepID=UPI0015FDCB61|nr:ROK family glucokinase [Flaviflexus huanghaiensis]